MPANLNCVKMTASAVDLMVKTPSLFDLSTPAKICLSHAERVQPVAVLKAQEVLLLLFLLLLEALLLHLPPPTRRLVVVLATPVLSRMLM